MKPAWICPRCGATLAAMAEAAETTEVAPTTTVARQLQCGDCDWSIESRDGVWQFTPELRPPGFSAARREHLEEISRSHFWFPPRQRLLSGLLARRAPLAEGVAALELGCGTGAFLRELDGRCRLVVWVDAYEESLLLAHKAAPGAVLIQADVCRVPLAGEQFDLIVALDVLEHVPPAEFLGEAARLATPDGALLLTVPALPALWSELDEAAGHRCRYRLRQLRAELATAGWRLLDWTHYQFLLLPLVWLSRRMPPLRRPRLERHPPAWLGRLLGGISDLEVAAFGRLSLPWGSSLVALAQRAP